MLSEDVVFPLAFSSLLLNIIKRGAGIHYAALQRPLAHVEGVLREDQHLRCLQCRYREEPAQEDHLDGGLHRGSGVHHSGGVRRHLQVPGVPCGHHHKAGAQEQGSPHAL